MAAIERLKDSIRSRYATQSSRSPRQAINSAAIPEFVLGLCFAECRPVSDRGLLAAQPARSQRRGRGWPPKLSGSQVRGSLFLTAPFIERVRGLTRGFMPPPSGLKADGCSRFLLLPTCATEFERATINCSLT